MSLMAQKQDDAGFNVRVFLQFFDIICLYCDYHYLFQKSSKILGFAGILCMQGFQGADLPRDP